MDAHVWFLLLAVWSLSATSIADDIQMDGRTGIISNLSGDYCSAVMLSAREVLTAAHCLFDTTGVPVPVAAVKYQSEKFGSLEIEGLAIHPDFLYQSRDIHSGVETDIALISVKNNRADRFSIGVAAAVYRGDKVVVQRGIAGQSEQCSVTNAVGQIFTLNCTAREGDSGAAIYLIGTSGVRELVGILSSIEMSQDSRYIIGVLVGEAVETLRVLLERGE